MQVNIGEKIKELRKRDGRKQEDVANALGVTAQAVSRWESNGCYPDMGMLPAIANYFHVSIDSLFGYDNDRDSRIKELTMKVNRYMVEHDLYNSDNTHIIELLRSSLEEFPGEPELLRLLALSLAAQGEQVAEKPNPYLTEAANVLEGLLKENNSVISQLLYIYTSMGDYDKAEKKAQEQPSIQTCREVLLASINEGKKSPYDGKKQKKYLGEVILILLHELEFYLDKAVAGNDKLNHSKEGLELLVAVRKLYEKLFAEDNYGEFHSDLCMLHLSCAWIAARIPDYDSVASFFDSAYHHYTKYEKIMQERRNNGYPDKCFSAPLLEEAETGSVPIVICRMDYFKGLIASLPENIKAEIFNNPQYALLRE